MERVFRRPNGQELTVQAVAVLLGNYMAQEPEAQYELTVGTDSQNYGKTRMVEVIAVRRVGRGGIFCYRVDIIPRIGNLRQKIHEETQRSLEIADELLQALESYLALSNRTLDDMDVHVAIHCDVGRAGNTKVLIQEIVGWVTALGYDCQIKPSSWCASAVADKYSK